MKIVLSQTWRREAATWVLIEAICILLSISFFSEDNGLMLIMCLFILLSSTVIQTIVFCCEYRFFTYVLNTEKKYKSYLLKRELCVIDKQEMIYYAIFWEKEAMFKRRRFIIISNKPFKYEEKTGIRIFPWDKKPLLTSYDVKFQIAMPYDEQTKSLFEIERWICVN